MIIVYTGKRHVRYGTLPIEAWVMDENGHVLQPPRQVGPYRTQAGDDEDLVGRAQHPEGEVL